MTDHIGFCLCFWKTFSHLLSVHQLNNLSSSIQLSISYKLFEISARTSFLSAVPFDTVMIDAYLGFCHQI